MEVEQGRGATPINLKIPAIKCKRWQGTHQRAFVHLSKLVMDTPLKNTIHENECKITGQGCREDWGGGGGGGGLGQIQKVGFCNVSF